MADAPQRFLLTHTVLGMTVKVGVVASSRIRAQTLLDAVPLVRVLSKVRVGDVSGSVTAAEYDPGDDNWKRANFYLVDPTIKVEETP